MEGLSFLPTASSQFLVRTDELLKLMLDTLQSLGLKNTVATLTNESGMGISEGTNIVGDLRQAVLGGCWAECLSLLARGPIAGCDAILLAVATLRQAFLESVLRGDLEVSLGLLQHGLSPLVGALRSALLAQHYRSGESRAPSDSVAPIALFWGTPTFPPLAAPGVQLDGGRVAGGDDSDAAELLSLHSAERSAVCGGPGSGVSDTCLLGLAPEASDRRGLAAGVAALWQACWSSTRRSSRSSSSGREGAPAARLASELLHARSQSLQPPPASAYVIFACTTPLEEPQSTGPAPKHRRLLEGAHAEGQARGTHEASRPTAAVDRSRLARTPVLQVSTPLGLVDLRPLLPGSPEASSAAAVPPPVPLTDEESDFIGLRPASAASASVGTAAVTPLHILCADPAWLHQLATLLLSAASPSLLRLPQLEGVPLPSIAGALTAGAGAASQATSGGRDASSDVGVLLQRGRLSVLRLVERRLPPDVVPPMRLPALLGQALSYQRGMLPPGHSAGAAVGARLELVTALATPQDLVRGSMGADASSLSAIAPTLLRDAPATGGADAASPGLLRAGFQGPVHAAGMAMRAPRAAGCLLLGPGGDRPSAGGERGAPSARLRSPPQVLKVAAWSAAQTRHSPGGRGVASVLSDGTVQVVVTEGRCGKCPRSREGRADAAPAAATASAASRSCAAIADSAAAAGAAAGDVACHCQRSGRINCALAVKRTLKRRRRAAAASVGSPPGASGSGGGDSSSEEDEDSDEGPSSSSGEGSSSSGGPADVPTTATGLPPFTEPVVDVAWSPCGRYLLTCGTSCGVALLWDLRRLACAQSPAGGPADLVHPLAAFDTAASSLAGVGLLTAPDPPLSGPQAASASGCDLQVVAGVADSCGGLVMWQLSPSGLHHPESGAASTDRTARFAAGDSSAFWPTPPVLAVSVQSSSTQLRVPATSDCSATGLHTVAALCASGVLIRVDPASPEAPPVQQDLSVCGHKVVGLKLHPTARYALLSCLGKPAPPMRAPGVPAHRLAEAAGVGAVAPTHGDAGPELAADAGAQAQTRLAAAYTAPAVLLGINGAVYDAGSPGQQPAGISDSAHSERYRSGQRHPDPRQRALDGLHSLATAISLPAQARGLQALLAAPSTRAHALASQPCRTAARGGISAHNLLQLELLRDALLWRMQRRIRRKRGSGSDSVEEGGAIEEARDSEEGLSLLWRGPGMGGAVQPPSSIGQSLPSAEVARLVLWDTETAMPVQVYAGHLNRKLLLEACFVRGVSVGASPTPAPAPGAARVQAGGTSTPDATLMALHAAEPFSVACGSEDGQLFLWDGGSGQLAARFPGHLGACNSVCALSCTDAASLRPAGGRGSKSLRPLAVDGEHEGERTSTLLGVQSTVLSGGDDGVVRLWSLCS